MTDVNEGILSIEFLSADTPLVRDVASFILGGALSLIAVVECILPLPIQRRHIHVQESHEGISSFLYWSRRPIGSPRHDLSNAVRGKSLPQYTLWNLSTKGCKYPLFGYGFPILVED